MDSLLRHIRSCNNAVLPGNRLEFRIGEAKVGWVLPRLASELGRDFVRMGDAVVLAAAAAPAFPGIVRGLTERGVLRWRNEAFDVRAAPDGGVLTQVDRGALPDFGILAGGVHVNGLVRREDGLHLWIARRAANKTLDPGKLDHLVAGGIPAGLDASATLVKEAAEEAGIPAPLARSAHRVERIAYAMQRPEGLRRDCLTCFDLMLPAEFRPCPVDGEVAGFELWAIDRVLERVRATDDFKFNVNLVLIGLFLRLGLIKGEERGRLRSALDALRPSGDRSADQ